MITSSLSSRYLVVSAVYVRIRVPKRSTPLHIRRMVFSGRNSGTGVSVGWNVESVAGLVVVVVDVDWVPGITEG